MTDERETVTLADLGIEPEIPPMPAGALPSPFESNLSDETWDDMLDELDLSDAEQDDEPPVIHRWHVTTKADAAWAMAKLGEHERALGAAEVEVQAYRETLETWHVERTARDRAGMYKLSAELEGWALDRREEDGTKSFKFPDGSKIETRGGSDRMVIEDADAVIEWAHRALLPSELENVVKTVEKVGVRSLETVAEIGQLPDESHVLLDCKHAVKVSGAVALGHCVPCQDCPPPEAGDGDNMREVIGHLSVTYRPAVVAGLGDRVVEVPGTRVEPSAVFVSLKPNT